MANEHTNIYAIGRTYSVSDTNADAFADTRAIEGTYLFSNVYANGSAYSKPLKGTDNCSVLRTNCIALSTTEFGAVIGSYFCANVTSIIEPDAGAILEPLGASDI